MHIRLVNVYLLNVPSVSSTYFNKINQTSHLGDCHALSLEILFFLFYTFYRATCNVSATEKGGAENAKTKIFCKPK